MSRQFIILRDKMNAFFQKSAHYGISFAFYDLLWWICFYVRTPFSYRLSSWALGKKTAWLDGYIGKKYSDIIDKYKNNPPKATLTDNYRIWVFWGQGEDAMPPLIKACYRQLTEYNDNAILVTNENVSDYIDISEVIKEKVTKGKLTWANYSDIIRNLLLSNYGGLWIDSTVWVSGELPMGLLLDSPLFTACGKVLPTPKGIRFWTSYDWNWSSWCMGSNKSSYLLFAFVGEMLKEIALREKYWPDYVIQDYLILYACRSFPSVKADMSEAQKVEAKRRNELATIMNDPYEETVYQDLIKEDYVFKLSFRSAWREQTDDGRQTFYSRIVNGVIDNSTTR